MLIEVVLRTADERRSHWLSAVKGTPVRDVPRGEGFVAMRIEYELADLVRELFGPSREHHAGVRETRLFPYAGSHAADQIAPCFLAAQQATATVLAGCTSAKPDLNELTSRYLTPKWGSLHWFTSALRPPLPPLPRRGGTSTGDRHRRIQAPRMGRRFPADVEALLPPWSDTRPRHRR